MNFVKSSDPLINKVLEAIGLESDKDTPIKKLTVTLECGKPAMVEIHKMVIDKEKSE